jgi:hypothetical protein
MKLKTPMRKRRRLGFGDVEETVRAGVKELGRLAGTKRDDADMNFR